MEILFHMNITIPDEDVERLLAEGDLLEKDLEQLDQVDLQTVAECFMDEIRTTWMDHVALAEILVWPGEEEDQDLPKKVIVAENPDRDRPPYRMDPPRPLTSSMSDDEKLTLVTSAIERGKAEILSDIGRDIVPEDVHSFSELHDFVDANEYGGLCDGHWPVAIIDGEEHLDVELANQVQDALDTWIKDGRP